MRRLSCALFLLVLVVGCGKNDGIRGVGNAPYPITQAPPPPNGGYPVPPGGYMAPPMPQYPNPGGYPGGPGGYQPTPYMVPQMPQGMPTRYTPFVPIDNFMRRRPQTHNYWNQFWAGWQQYSKQNRYDQYDFNRFWFEYCPDNWEGTDWAQVYNTFDADVYYWVAMDTQISVDAQPDYFWQNYYGMPYSGLDSYCSSNCY